MATLHKMGEIRKGPALEEVERLAMQTGHVIAVAQKSTTRSTTSFATPR